MRSDQVALTKRNVVTPSGRISYTEAGAGPVALFVHGVLLNGHLWRHQQTGLGARIFFPEERAAEFNQELRAHWLASSPSLPQDRHYGSVKART